MTRDMTTDSSIARNPSTPVVSSESSAPSPMRAGNPEHHVPADIPDCAAVARALGLPIDVVSRIVESLRRGDQMMVCRGKTGSRISVIRRVAAQIGWRHSWRRRALQVGNQTRASVLASYDAGIEIPDIAREAGVSVQRIRQVAAEEGRAPRGKLPRPERDERIRREDQRRVAREQAAQQRDVLKTTRSTDARIRAERRAARRADLERSVPRAHDLWCQRVPLADIAAAYRVSEGAMKYLIQQARRLRPDWFPHRSPVTRLLKKRGFATMTGHSREDVDSRNMIDRIQKLCGQGYSADQMIAVLGLEPWRFRWLIRRERRRRNPHFLKPLIP